ncbi:MAG: glycosyl transferase family 1 [Rhodospirillales bacterium CG15_BIG_FIL_POST_REV_8_21_14_020_66_15]|nr:MAG: glycosyl transferase family 1 [Rhodospirillales bacterium CG15_BIG_FIL_POST_REV_8_21_14_020_66_15]
MLHVNDMTFRLGGRVLFEKATLHLPQGRKMGLVGRNGTGKTTLFRMILGDAHPDEGAVRVRPSARIGTVAQEAPSGAASLLDTVLAADTERSALQAEAETAKDPSRIADIHNRLADIDAQTAPARAARILAGLGFDEAAQARPCGEFSGGWRMRVALAATLFSRPDFLLLDEPTNHLDLEAALWLETYLASWPGTLLVISHDRTLLNKVVDEIAHLSERKLTRYVGNYDRFERTRRERQAQQSKLQAKQLSEKRRIQAFVDRFRAKATKARQAQSRMKMLARMEPIATVVEDKTTTFNFPDPDPLSPPLIALDGVSVGYGTEPVLKNLDLRIDMDDRIGLIGANGNGKSTLIKMLADRLKPLAGKVTKSSKLKVGYFAQHQQEELRLNDSPFQHMARIMPMATETKVRAHLGRFGFSGDLANSKVEVLSGGEKARLLFALMSTEAPHILFLDEPTNHLDVDAREALVQALNEYDGAIVLVTHDAHLIDLVCDRLWLVADGGCKPFDGDLEAYAGLLMEQRREARRDARAARDGDGVAAVDKKELRRERARRREETSALRRAVQDAEKKMEKLAQEVAALEARLAAPEVYNGPTAKLMDLQVAHKRAKDSLAETEQAWLSAQEAIDETLDEAS